MMIHAAVCVAKSESQEIQAEGLLGSLEEDMNAVLDDKADLERKLEEADSVGDALKTRVGELEQLLKKATAASPEGGVLSEGAGEEIVGLAARVANLEVLLEEERRRCEAADNAKIRAESLAGGGPTHRRHK